MTRKRPSIGVRFPNVFPNATSIVPAIHTTPSWLTPPPCDESSSSLAHLRSRLPSFAVPPRNPRRANAPAPTEQVAPSEPLGQDAELEVLRAEMDELRARNEVLADSLAQAAEALATLRATTIDEVEADVVSLATAIAHRAVGAELEVQPQSIVGWVTQGLQHLVLENGVTVHVGPRLAERVPQTIWARAHAGVRIVVEDGASDYHCEVRTPNSVGASASLARRRQPVRPCRNS